MYSASQSLGATPSYDATATLEARPQRHARATHEMRTNETVRASSRMRPRTLLRQKKRPGGGGGRFDHRAMCGDLLYAKRIQQATYKGGYHMNARGQGGIGLEPIRPIPHNPIDVPGARSIPEAFVPQLEEHLDRTSATVFVAVHILSKPLPTIEPLQEVYGTPLTFCEVLSMNGVTFEGLQHALPKLVELGWIRVSEPHSSLAELWPMYIRAWAEVDR
jgi:hypothetical protein